MTRPGAGSVADYAVVLFSTDSLKWYLNSQVLKLERCSQDGGFRIGSLPPGSYDRVTLSNASDLITSGSWRDPATLERLHPLATAVTVQEGVARVVVLPMTSDRWLSGLGARRSQLAARGFGSRNC